MKVGLGAGFLAAAIPCIVWFLRSWWRPSPRNYAWRFSLWPLILSSSQLGGPLARWMADIPSRNGGGVADKFLGVFGVSVLLAPFAFGVGYLVSKMVWPEGAPSPAAAATPPDVQSAEAAQPKVVTRSEARPDALSGKDPLVLIAGLKKLFDEGAITREEFDCKRSELLRRI